MENAILWCGFLGAWLLVAGPLSQATRELEDEELVRDDLVEASKGVERPPPVSRWWILVPPVFFYLRHRRSNEYRARIIEALADEQVEAMASFRDKVGTWLYVAGGAFLIAVKETWELREGYEWEEWVFWALILLLLVFCAVLTAARTRVRRDPRGAMEKSLGER